MRNSLVLAAGLMITACNTSQPKEDSNMVRLITLAPGHFHAALVQKSMYPGMDSVVKVFAPEGPELKAHLALIEQYNTRPEDPTRWKEDVYTGSDFLQKMTEQQKGSVVVLAGNNQQKTDYISAAVNAGMNVLADKPMVISEEGFKKLEQIFPAAAEKKVLVYDIMTERSEITNMLQKELLHQSTVFGELEKGTADKPAVEIESIHHFYKSVSGKTLRRPSWFFDPSQQGDAIVDVNTHLVDLAQWICFDTAIIDYRKDIRISRGEKWRTPLTLSQFSAITGEAGFPSFLQGFVKQDSILDVPANGSIYYSLNGVHIRATALWNYEAPEGGGDSHYAIMRGTKANLVINQGKEENWKPELYIEPKQNDAAYTEGLQAAIRQLSAKYPGISLENKGARWKVVIPDNLKTGHEAHFADVMQRYLQFLQQGKVPEWEVKNILAKYYVTTAGLAVAKEK
jgi:predicted dehydrogenase